MNNQLIHYIQTNDILRGFFIVFGTVPKVWYFVFDFITPSITVMEAGGLAP
jgi:hypothetical protein